MKKTLWLSLLLALCLLCVCAAAEETQREIFTSGDYQYALLEDGTAEIVEYNGKDSVLTIPDDLESYQVTAIGNSSFSHCSSLSSVTLPDSVTTIGNSVFSFCTRLSSVEIPDSVTTIGNFAFSGCYSLSSVTIPDSVTTIGNFAFTGCPKLTLTVPRNSYAVQYCKDNDLRYNYPDSLDWLNN